MGMKTLLFIAFMAAGMVAKAQTLIFKQDRFNTSVFVSGELKQSDIKHLFRYAKTKKHISKWSDVYIHANGVIYYQPPMSLKIFEVVNGDLVRLRKLS